VIGVDRGGPNGDWTVIVEAHLTKDGSIVVDRVERKAPMARLGRSQQAVYDWLKSQKEAMTAWDVGNALYDDVSMCSKKNSDYSGRVQPEEKIRTRWASKILCELMRKKFVWPAGIVGRASTYKVIR
jgi:hypothetical protein